METKLREIIEYGIWAPSGDNSQPWYFKIQNNEVLVYIYPEKDNPILNWELSGTYIAAGALIENINIAATHYGFQTNVILFPEKDKKYYVAKIVFSQEDILEDSLFSYIKTRCTNRKPYKKVPLTSIQKNLLLDLGGGVQGVKILIIDKPEDVKQVAYACSTTEKIALETPAIHKLFFESIVWSREEEKRRGIGLYVLTLELPPSVRALFKILKYWTVTNLFNKIGFSKIAAKGNAKIYSSSSALCSIVIDKTTPEGFVNAGQLTQRIWLTATSLGLSVQPITGILFFIMRWRVEETHDFLPKHIPDIKKAYEDIYPIYGLKDEIIAMHLRIGVDDVPTARSLRVEPKIIVE